MNTLYIITGPAGVGKSTVSLNLANKLEKSALVEGDFIYHFVKGGYISPWKDGNHLDIFWKNSINIINNFLENGYDVVFNYIIKKNDLEIIKRKFPNVKIKFIVLLADSSILIERDKERPIDCQMGDRVLVLLNEFKQENFDNKYLLDTSNLKTNEIVEKIIKDSNLLI